MLEAWVESTARRVGEGMGATRVWVFGSRAVNRQSRHSDLDLFVECETELRPLDRIQRVFDLAGDLPCALDAIVYTRDEIARNLHSKFLQRVFAEGVIAYEPRQVT